MPIKVRFSRRGFYHPALGRLGMGDNAGRIYQLPDLFLTPGMLPKECEILDGLSEDELEAELERAAQEKVDKPRTDPVELERAAEAAKKASAAAAKKKKPAAKKAAPEPEPEPEPEAEEADAPIKRRSRRTVN